MLNQFVFVYLDDILIFPHTLEQHRQHVRLVLQRLLENKLYVKSEKYEFHSSSVSFLGHKQLQRSLGFANFYRRFIREYSKVAAPLTQFTSVKRPFSQS